MCASPSNVLGLTNAAMEVRKTEDIHLEFIEQQLNAANVTLDDAIEYNEQRQKERHKVWARRISKQYQVSLTVGDLEPNSLEDHLKNTGRNCSEPKRALLNKISEESKEQHSSAFESRAKSELREVELEKRRAKVREHKRERKKREMSESKHMSREQRLEK